VLPNNQFNNNQIQTVSLSPNSRKLAFVFENNIFIMSKFYDGIRDSLQITSDGKENTIYNGMSDWLYEEEILYQTDAMWWSPDSSKLAYIKFNDSKVEYYSFSMYDNSQYGHLNKIRYPKPDTPNPEASVYVFNTEMGDTHRLLLPKIVSEKFKEYYIWNIKWMGYNQIIVVYVNRKQNKAVTAINDAGNGYVILAKVLFIILNRVIFTIKKLNCVVKYSRNTRLCLRASTTLGSCHLDSWHLPYTIISFKFGPMKDLRQLFRSIAE
jgi:hypothetical protein